VNLPVRSFRAEGFRSLQVLAYPMSGLDVFVGGNGAGKTNLYRALALLQSAAANRLAHDLAAEGGLGAAFWAGPRKRTKPPVIRLAASFEVPSRQRTQYDYQVVVGFPQTTAAAFATEPQIKEETVTLVSGGRPVRLLDRKGASVMARNEEGRPTEIALDLLSSETVLGRLEDPGRYPELQAIRQTLLQWRFYHDLRTDAGSPLRQPCPAVATPTLASDGADLAAVFATLAHIREDTTELDAAIDGAFPGAQLIIPSPERVASFGLRYPEFPQRVFEAHELSDGTLRFLALAGALLAYRLPPFVALNEPEASLHPDLMEPLADMIAQAARRTQLWLVTHSTQLADALAKSGAGQVRRVFKTAGATTIEGLTAWGEFDEEED
jgi:predicted ATPase